MSKTKKVAELPQVFDSPVDAYGYRVCLRHDPVQRVTESGIIMSSGSEGDRKQAGQIWGTIIDAGPVAFTGPEYGEGEREKILAGSRRVLFRRYSGQSFEAVSSVESRPKFILCADTDILAGVKTGEELTLLEDRS